MTAPMLQVEKLSAWYGAARILYDLDLDVGRGEVVALMGRNGAGKTTTMKAIMALVAARSGTVRFNGEFYFPMTRDYAETVFSGDFPTATDYLDPYVRQKLAAPGNWAVYPPNPYGPNTLNYFSTEPFPAPPGR